nr:mucin-2-like [Lytechinus pictus]
MSTIAASTSSTQGTIMIMNPTTTPTSTLATTEITSRPKTSTPEATTELTRQSTSAPFTTQPKSSSPVMEEFSTEVPADRSSTRSLDDVTPPSIPQTSTYKVPESTIHSSTSATITQSTSIHVTTTNATSKQDTTTQETTTQLPIVQETETQGILTQGPVIQETTTQATTTQPLTTRETTTQTTTTLGTTTQATTTQSPTTKETTTQTSATLGNTTQSTTTQVTTIQTTARHSTTTNATTTKPASTIRTTQQDTTVAPGIPKVFVTDHQNSRIVWADLHGPERMEFSVFQSLPYKPMDIAFDHVEQMVYWSSKEEKRIWRIDVIGGSKEAVINQNFQGVVIPVASFFVKQLISIYNRSQTEPLGIAIAEHSRHLYCTYESQGWISRVEIGNPNSETLFVDGLFKPKAIAIDERNGYLYWSRHEGIDRKRLNSTSPSVGVEEVINLPVFSEMNGLIINSNGTRLFFCDENSKRALYLDIARDGGTGSAGGNAIDIIEEGFLLRDVGMGFDGELYWLQPGQKRIVVMDDYRTSNEFHFEAQQEFDDPQRMHIARVIV